MENPYNTQNLDRLVKQYIAIGDVTYGDAGKTFIVRYRGKLLQEDTADSYERLYKQLEVYNITPLFRWDKDQHAIFLVPGKPKPKPTKKWVNLLLFILTLFSVLLTGALYGLEELPDGNLVDIALAFINSGWPFAVSMLAILGAHELGHYFAGRHHGVDVTLPYFIPMPLSPFGTMGAFINMRSIPKNRRQLLDIGIAGPLAGLIVSIPILLLGLHLSDISQLPFVRPTAFSLQMEGNSLIYLISKFIVFGKWLPEPINYGNLPPLLYWVKYFFTGQPFPFGAMDVMLHPVAWAGWAGLLVTGLNLIPAGQLDGGHMIYVLLGSKGSRRLLPIILIGLGVLGLAWNGWWLWAVLIYFLGRVHAEPLDQITELDSGRKTLAVLAVVIFFLTFTPVPLSIL